MTCDEIGLMLDIAHNISVVSVLIVTFYLGNKRGKKSA